MSEIDKYYVSQEIKTAFPFLNDWALEKSMAIFDNLLNKARQEGYSAGQKAMFDQLLTIPQNERNKIFRSLDVWPSSKKMIFKD